MSSLTAPSLATPSSATLQLTDSSELNLPELKKDEQEEGTISSPADLEKAEPQNATAFNPSDWLGPDDPANPLNWPRWTRHLHVVPPALISFTATFGSSIYTPAISEVMERYGVSITVAFLPLSMYTLALALGPIIGAPLSETYGRHVVYLISPPLGALFTLGAGFSPTFAGLVIMRFIAGMFFSPALAIGAGTVADTHPANQRAAPTALYILSPFLGPALGPVIGGFVSVRKNWQWTQWTLIFFAIFSWICVLPMKETYKKTIIARRDKKLGYPPPPSPFPNTAAKLRFFLTVTLIRPLHMLFMEPIVTFLSLYIGFNFAVLFTFFAAFPEIFGSVYDFDVEQSGLVFLAIGVGCVLAIPTVLLADKYLYQKQYRLSHAAGKSGVVHPEYRLYTAMAGSFAVPIGLFWFGWTVRPSVHWISPVLAAIPFAWGNVSIFIGSGTYLLDTYQSLNGASALAANGLLRYVLGAAFPLFTLQMYARLGNAWASSLLGFIALAMMPIPWVLFKFGERIRASSKYETIKT